MLGSVQFEFIYHSTSINLQQFLKDWNVFYKLFIFLYFLIKNIEIWIEAMKNLQQYKNKK